MRRKPLVFIVGIGLALVVAVVVREPAGHLLQADVYGGITDCPHEIVWGMPALGITGGCTGRIKECHPEEDAIFGEDDPDFDTTACYKGCGLTYVDPVNGGRLPDGAPCEDIEGNEGTCGWELDMFADAPFMTSPEGGGASVVWCIPNVYCCAPDAPDPQICTLMPMKKCSDLTIDRVMAGDRNVGVYGTDPEECKAECGVERKKVEDPKKLRLCEEEGGYNEETDTYEVVEGCEDTGGEWDWEDCRCACAKGMTLKDGRCVFAFECPRSGKRSDQTHACRRQCKDQPKKSKLERCVAQCVCECSGGEEAGKKAKACFENCYLDRGTERFSCGSIKDEGKADCCRAECIERRCTGIPEPTPPPKPAPGPDPAPIPWWDRILEWIRGWF